MLRQYRVPSAAVFGGMLWLVACDEAGSAPPSETQSELIYDNADGGAEPGPAFDRYAAWTCAVPRIRPCDDGQIAAILFESDQGEIDVSQSVIERVTDPPVVALAERLIADHTRSRDELAALLEDIDVEPIENDNSRDIAESAQLALVSLASKSGEELERAYVSHALLHHAKALGTIDHILLPSVRDRQFESNIRRSRVAIARHLLLTSDVQKDVAGMCGGDLTPSDAGVSDAGTVVDAASTVDASGIDATTAPAL